MKIIHDLDKGIVQTEENGQVAYVEYKIGDGVLDIRHTYVPKPVEGRGIASKLVQYAYDYARGQGLHPVATCSYAVVWLQRHPQYLGRVGEDYGGSGSCVVDIKVSGDD